ncbi:hypothetical protein ACTHSZ_24110, partial [Neisseria sp. P0006.S006]
MSEASAFGRQRNHQPFRRIVLYFLLYLNPSAHGLSSSMQPCGFQIKYWLHGDFPILPLKSA